MHFSEKAMAPHSSTLAWKIPWMEEPGGLQFMGSLGVGHDWATSLSLFTFRHWRGNGNPLQCSCLQNPRDGGAWWAAVYGVAQSQTRLKWLSGGSSRGIALMIRWLRLHIPNTRCTGLIPGQSAKILHAAEYSKSRWEDGIRTREKRKKFIVKLK